MSRGFSRDTGEATRAGFGHGFAGGRSAVPSARDPVPPYWITAQSNCPEFSLEFPIKLPEQAQAIRIAVCGGPARDEETVCRGPGRQLRALCGDH